MLGPQRSTPPVPNLSRRLRSLMGTGAVYEMRIEATDRLLLSARRRAKNKCSSYLIATLDAAAGEVAPAADEAVAKVGAGLGGVGAIGGGPSIQTCHRLWV